jgi:DNA replication protein DnaC
MLTENTVSKLHEMKLSVMAQTFREQTSNHELMGLSFEDRFSLIVDAEWASRKSNRLNRLIRSSEYALPGASVENIEYLPDRKLDKTLISRLASCAYVLEANNVIILGATGAGKTYLASALGMAANRNFYAVRYVRLPDLLSELAISRGDGTYRKIMKQYKLADAICDRIVHNSYTIKIDGDSMRKRKGISD